MVSKKRAGILAAAVIAAVGFGTMGHTAQAATAPGEDGESVSGYTVAYALSGVASTCTDPGTGTFSIAWTFNTNADSPGYKTVLSSASAGGLVPATVVGGVVPAAKPRTSLTGSATYTSTATITQTIVFLGTVTNNVPADVPGIKTTLTATVDSPCKATDITVPTTTTTLAPTTTTAAPTTTQAAPTTTAAVTTTAKATTTTKAAVLAATALPSTGSNSGMVIAVGFAFGIAGVTLVRMDRKRKLYA
jgi:LPXTG-motif cell wall-anchored protein